MLKRILRKILLTLLDKPVPPMSSSENKYLSDLIKTYRTIPIFDTDGYSPSEASWRSNMNRLRELILNSDPRKFLRWDVINKTMFVSFARYIRTELRYLKKRPDWNLRWCNAIEESPVGNPIPYHFYPSSSGNLIHHAYHIAKFEEKTRSQVHNFDFVFEFGGGYGSMCRLFHNLGFCGKYVIFDLSVFSALQCYYLKTLGLPVQSEDTFSKGKNGVICVSEIQRIREIFEQFGNQIKKNNSLFIATWSLSESPISVRESLLQIIPEFTSFLITYQETFGEVNNIDFFDKWKNEQNLIDWYTWPIEHIPGNNYLVGKAFNS